MYVIGIVMFHDKGFQKPQVFLNLFISNAGLIVIATSMTMVIISGGIDISVGSFVALTCMMLAYMMEKGKIIEQGNHATLMAQNGTYRKLVEMQSFQ